MYGVLPLWLAAGFADYLCHRASGIENTTGWRESLLHLLQFGEMALPILAALFLQINTGVILLMIVCLVLHQATAMWDVRFAAGIREVKPIEQHVHSVLEMLPLTALLMVIALHWTEFTSLFGVGTSRFDFAWKNPPLSSTYLAAILGATAALEILPYFEEFIRGLRTSNRKHS